MIVVDLRDFLFANQFRAAIGAGRAGGVVLAIGAVEPAVEHIIGRKVQQGFAQLGGDLGDIAGAVAIDPQRDLRLAFRLVHGGIGGGVDDASQWVARKAARTASRTERSRRGRPSAISSTSGGARSISALTTWPVNPVTTIRIWLTAKIPKNSSDACPRARGGRGPMMIIFTSLVKGAEGESNPARRRSGLFRSLPGDAGCSRAGQGSARVLRLSRGLQEGRRPESCRSSTPTASALAHVSQPPTRHLIRGEKLSAPLVRR